MIFFRKYIVRQLFGSFWLILCSLSAMAQNAPSVRTGLDDNSILIGDQIHYWIEMDIPDAEGKTVTWPSVRPPAKVELLNKPRVDTERSGNRLILKQQFVVTSFDSGRYILPSFDFQVKDRHQKITHLYSDTVGLYVNTVAVDTTQPFKPEKEVEDGPLAWWEHIPGLAQLGYALQHWWQTSAVSMILVALLITALILYLVFRKKKQPAQEKVPPEKAHQKALRRLDELDQKGLWEKGEVKAFYSDMSDIVREYLEDRFGISAMEQTTDELLKAAKQHTAIRKVRPELKQVLTLSDLAKFAKMNPAETEHTAALTAARDLIHKSKIRPEEGKVQ